MRRREFLKAGASGVGVAATGGLAAACAPMVPTVPVTTWSAGIASGLHSPTELVLWTRVDPGAEPGTTSVDWEVATDPAFATIVASGTAAVSTASDSTVKVLAGGLSPATDHWYRFVLPASTSPVGHARTMPAPGDAVSGFTFAFASCQAYACGYYGAWRDIAARDLDAVLFLGDYIYEAATIQLLGKVREEGTVEAKTLAQYRAKYRLYKSDPDLQAAHAAHAFMLTWDDHEIHNDYDKTVFILEPQRAADAYQAWFEYQPVWPTDGTRIYRDVRWGDLGHLFVLDTRQYRDDHSPGAPLIGIRPLGQAEVVPTRTILGADQKAWLLGGLADAQADGVPWKLIGNPTMIAPIRVVDLDTPENRALDPNLIKHAGFYTNSNFDSWDGFPVERDAVLSQLATGGIENVSFLSGDYHSFWQAGLTPDFDDPTAPVVANDFAAGAISSAGGAFTENALYGGHPTTSPTFSFIDTTSNGYGLVEGTSAELAVTYLAFNAQYRSATPQPKVRFTLTPGDPIPTITPL
jgi:alkaline phosphatase D